jgi:hypothetical protein
MDPTNTQIHAAFQLLFAGQGQVLLLVKHSSEVSRPSAALSLPRSQLPDTHLHHSTSST